MQITKKEFKRQFLNELDMRYSMNIEEATNSELYDVLAAVVRRNYSDLWRKTRSKEEKTGTKQVYYFSIEFLPGTLLRSNLLNLGWLDTVKEVMADLKLDFEAIAHEEPDMALGNGGLGRLAAAFMDSLASTGYTGNGNGLRYKYGLFRQKLVDGYQVELPNEWLQNRGNRWEVRRESKSELVRFGGKVHMVDDNGWLTPQYEGGQVLRAVPYDVALVGYGNEVINTLRLWDAEIPAENELDYPTIKERRAVEDLTSVLYPDDSSYEGRLMRLKQEYFFVSAGLQSIVRYYHKKLKGQLTDLADHVAVHINDTHPALAVAELMRLLVDEYHMDWDRAWRVTVDVMSYTNHTIMAEALEQWDTNMLAELLPRTFEIIQEIDRRYVQSLEGRIGGDVIERTRIISGGRAKMAHLAIIGSHSVNGVAELHTQLLKTEVLADFFRLFPERFNNKTNGITLRRWIQIANPELAILLDQTVGKDWRHDEAKMIELEECSNDKKILKQINDIKLNNKKKLAKVIKDQTGVVVDPEAIFDVQVKRLHAYKRQTLKLLHILKVYKDLKNGIDHPKRVVIFGAKAAPSYVFAKQVIKVINEVANLVNNDASIHDKLKVVFLEDYGVTLAEQIIPAADLSEQISTTTKEASGTSNMKLMANGALTIATMDGANIEIADSVGQENIFTFGMSKDEVYKAYNNKSYDPQAIYNYNPEVRETMDMLIDGTIPYCAKEGQALFENFVSWNEQFFVLQDFDAYMEAQTRVEKTRVDREKWAKMALINIAHSHRFNSDDTIVRYAKEIWGLTPIADKKKG